MARSVAALRGNFIGATADNRRYAFRRSMKNINTPIIILIILITIIPSGCDFKVNPISFNRSGPVNEDDVEEPISNKSKEYEKALLTSNEIMDNFINGNLSEVYNKYTSPILQNKVNENDFTKLYASVIEKSGPIQSYKKMQWWFEQNQDRVPRLSSVKKLVIMKSKFYFIILYLSMVNMTRL